MKSIGVGLRSFNRDLSRVLKPPSVTRTLATNAAALDNPADDNQSNNSFESVNEFERRIFGGIAGGNSKTDAFFEKIDRLGRGRKATGSRPGGGNYFSSLEGLDESFNTLSDGMDGKLKKAATYFEYDPEEIEKEDYSFRPDMNFRKGMTYDVKDLDLTKPGVRKPFKRYEFETTTEEVLKKADFRNVRFLANFLTKAGIIIKRSQTGISAKAQRKVAREIKTARAFGLMPFTLMGSKEFTFGKTMEDLDEDYEYESYENSADADAKNPFGDFGV